VRFFDLTIEGQQLRRSAEGARATAARRRQGARCPGCGPTEARRERCRHSGRARGPRGEIESRKKPVGRTRRPVWKLR
jgi:hypothetical protein